MALFGPYRRRVALLVATTLAGALLSVGTPLLTKVVFDGALFPHSGHSRLGLLVGLVGAMLVLAGLGGLTAIAGTYLASVIGHDVMHDLRDRLYGHLQRMSLRFFTSTRTGDIQSRIADDVGGVQHTVTRTLAQLLQNVIFVAIALAAMGLLAWQLMLISLMLVPVFAAFSRRVGRRRHQLASSTQTILADMSVMTQETLSVSGVLLGKVFGRERDHAQRYRETSRRLAAIQVREQMAGRTFLGLAQMFFALSPGLIYLAAGFIFHVHHGTGVTPGTLIALTALQTRLFYPVLEMLEVSLDLSSAMALFERVFEYLDLPSDIEEAPDARTLEPSRARGAVAFRDIHFRYDSSAAHPPPDRPWTLEGITLDIEPGQLVALVGPSGAGKTTLAHLVPRLYDPDRGAVLIDGHDVRELRLDSLAALVGVVTQEPFLFHASVRENLLYARPDASAAEVEEAARAAAIHDRIVELDEGYDTLVGERGYRMSGGEKQRLALARVILKQPRILILDEATSSLDTANERLVQAALVPVMRERTTIAIAHRLSTILAADVIYVLDRGRVVERGTHAELATAGGLYQELYEHQFRFGIVDEGPRGVLVPANGNGRFSRAPAAADAGAAS